MSDYAVSTFGQDLIAALVVTVLLVPQSLAYALLAGLPAQAGIYASIVPLVAYVIFGSSRHLTVGPTAIVSILTASAIAGFPEEMRLAVAGALAVLVGAILIGLGLLRGGIIMNFVSRPVVSAYITGAGLLIIVSQLRHVLGIPGGGDTALERLRAVFQNIWAISWLTLLIGAGTIAFLILARRYVPAGLFIVGMRAKRARIFARTAPLMAVILTIIVSSAFELRVATVGPISGSLPPLALPAVNSGVYVQLGVTAVVVAVVAFIDSMSVAQTLAAKSRTRIDADRELIGMGASNMVAGVTGGYPVNGSLSRSIVNFTAGAQTPVAGLLTAGFMLFAALYLTPVLRDLPLATLAGLIIVACLGLLDFKSLWRTWQYSKADGITALACFLAVLVFGVQWGVLIGIVLSMALHIQTTLTPHLAIVGRVPGTEHYRDSSRFLVDTDETVITLRIDESLYYANARYLEDQVASLVQDMPDMTDLILMCPAVNRIDASALGSLVEINRRLNLAEIKLHLSELHSRVRERLHRSDFIDTLSGRIFFSQHEAMEALAPEPDWSQISDHIDIH